MRKYIFLFLSLLIVLPFSIANASTPKSWTFLIFLNGNNNLDYYGEDNIKAMEQVGSNDNVNILVEWASESAGKVVRLLVQKSTDPNKVTSPILQDLGAVDMGSYLSLEDFIKWGVENYPADHYFIDVWDHGSGWHLRYKNVRSSVGYVPPLAGDISYDDNTHNSISTEQLGEVMKYAASLIGHKVDLYGSDACLMGMSEVAAEMADSVDYFVGSQETEPGAGWPYTDFLSAWFAKEDAKPSDVASILVDTYVKSYQNGSNGTSDVTMSAYNLSKLADFNEAVATLGADIQALNAKDKKAVLSLAKSSLRFAYHDYADLLNFVQRIKNSKVKISEKHLSAIKDAAADLIIANEVTNKYRDAKGISIWLPVRKSEYKEYSKRYEHLIFNQETRWRDALSYLLNA